MLSVRPILQASRGDPIRPQVQPVDLTLPAAVPLDPLMALRFAVIRLSALDGESWDAFARRCAAGLRSSSSRLQSIRLKAPLGHSLQLWEVYVPRADGPRKIAQCAVAHHRGRTIFYDGLQVLPEALHLWPALMKELLAALGPGEFEYGWEWSLEPPREDELSTMAGVRILSVRAVDVHGVDFSRWPDWESYLRQVRKSVRYEAKIAEAKHPGLHLVHRRGWRALPSLATLNAARRGTLRRKGIPPKGFSTFAAHLVDTLMGRDLVLVATMRQGRRSLAWFFGHRFGALTYYWSGAQSPRAFGASWRLLLEMLKQAYDRDPGGKFLMGFVDRPDPNAHRAEGLLNSREALRVSCWPTSRVRFAWSGEQV